MSALPLLKSYLGHSVRVISETCELAIEKLNFEDKKRRGLAVEAPRYE